MINVFNASTLIKLYNNVGLLGDYMAIFGNMFSKKKKNEGKSANSESPFGKADMNPPSASPSPASKAMGQENPFGSSGKGSDMSLPDLDLPDFDTLVGESSGNNPFENNAEANDAFDFSSGNTGGNVKNKQEKKSEKKKESLSSSSNYDGSFSEEVSVEDFDKVEESADGSDNLYDGDYFVSVFNYKTIFETLESSEKDFEKFSEKSSVLFSDFSMNDKLFQNVDNTFEEIHRKVLFIEGLCFNDE